MRTFPGCVLPVLGSLALVALLAAAGCEPEVPGTIDGTCDPDRAAEVTSSDYFETVMKPQVFEPYCSHCHWSTNTGAERHGAPVGLDYDTEEGANQRQALLVRRREIKAESRNIANRRDRLFEIGWPERQFEND